MAGVAGFVKANRPEGQQQIIAQTAFGHKCFRLC
jgi:hypothetical protein